MTRPVKQTVDYFSHDADASERKTVSILENHFGAEGYATWFKLLELISRTNNHVIILRNGEETEFLAAKLRLKPDKLLLILNKIAELEAIDPELWAHKVIWSQHFVDRLHEVYSNRHQPLPPRPEVNSTNNDITRTNNPISTPDNPQSKLNYSKLNYSKGNNIVFPDWLNKEIWNDFLEMRKKMRKSPTDKAITLLLKDLDNYRTAGDDPNKVVEQSIKNGYQGLFPLKNNSEVKSSPRNLPKTYTKPEDL